MNDRALENKLRARSARIAIIGLGYAGPANGGRVRARRVSRRRPRRRRVARSSDHGVAQPRLECEPTPRLRSLRVDDRLDGQHRPARAGYRRRGRHLRADAADPSGGPDLRFVEIGRRDASPSTCTPACWWCCRAPADRARPPGHCDRCWSTASGLRAGEDFFLVFAPERIDPGNTRFTVKNTPKLVGGATPESTRLACLLYRAVHRRGRPGQLARSRRTGQAGREHVPLHQHQLHQRDGVAVRSTGRQRLGSDRGGQDQAVRVHGPLSEPGRRRPLHPGRAAVFAGRGARTRPAERADSGRQPRQRGHAASWSSTSSSTRWNDRVANRWSMPACWSSGVTYKPDIADIRESAAIARARRSAGARRARALSRSAHADAARRRWRTCRLGRAGHDAISRALDAVVLLTPHTTHRLRPHHAPARAWCVDTHSGLQPREAPNVVNVWVPERLDSRILA